MTFIYALTGENSSPSVLQHFFLFHKASIVFLQPRSNVYKVIGVLFFLSKCLFLSCYSPNCAENIVISYCSVILQVLIYFTAVTICNNNIIKRPPRQPTPPSSGQETTTMRMRTERLNKVADFLLCKV